MYAPSEEGNSFHKAFRLLLRLDQHSVDTLKFVHRLLQVDNFVKAISLLIAITGGSEKWHHPDDVIWFSKVDFEDDEEPKSVRYDVEFITD